MNTKVLPEQIRKLLNQPRQLAYLLGLFVVIALGAVLFLTVLRVQNTKSTISRTRADAKACTPGGANNGGCGTTQVCGTDGFCGGANDDEKSCNNGDMESCLWVAKYYGNAGALSGLPPHLEYLLQAVRYANKAVESGAKCGENDVGSGTTVDPCKIVSAAKALIPKAKTLCYSQTEANGIPSCCFSNAHACTWPTRGWCKRAEPDQCGGDYSDRCGGVLREACYGLYSQACLNGGDCGNSSIGTGGGGSGQGCNSSSPDDVWSCYQQTGNCGGAWACHNGTSGCPAACGTGGVGGGGGGGSGQGCNSSSPADVWSCYQKNGGNCSAAWACHNDPGSSDCSAACGKKAGDSCTDANQCRGNQVCLGGKCTKLGQTHLECGSNSTCTRMAGKTDNTGGCTLEGASCGGTTCIDSQCPSGQACFNNACQAYHLGCGSDNTCGKVQGTGQNTCASLGVSCDGGTCVDSQCPTGQACFSGSCKASHFGCTSSNVCAKIEGAGANTGGCAVAGQVCGGELGSCWGNEGLNGRCVDCNGDGVINILDFSCLACNWSEKFTADQNPSCRTNNAD